MLQTVLLELARDAAKTQASPASAFREWSCQAVPCHTLALSPSFAVLAATSSAFDFLHNGQVEGSETGAGVKWCVHLECSPTITILTVSSTTNPVVAFPTELETCICNAVRRNHANIHADCVVVLNGTRSSDSSIQISRARLQISTEAVAAALRVLLPIVAQAGARIVDWETPSQSVPVNLTTLTKTLLSLSVPAASAGFSLSPSYHCAALQQWVCKSVPLPVSAISASRAAFSIPPPLYSIFDFIRIVDSVGDSTGSMERRVNIKSSSDIAVITVFGFNNMSVNIPESLEIRVRNAVRMSHGAAEAEVVKVITGVPSLHDCRQRARLQITTQALHTVLQFLLPVIAESGKCIGLDDSMVGAQSLPSRKRSFEGKTGACLGVSVLNC